MPTTFFGLWDPFLSPSPTLGTTEVKINPSILVMDHHLNTLNLYNLAGSHKTNRVTAEIWVYLKGS